MDPPKDYKLPLLYSIAFTSSLGSMAWGYNISIFNLLWTEEITIDLFKKGVNALRVYLQTTVFPDASSSSISLLASSLTIGAAFGSFQAGKLVNTYGRLNTLIWSDILGIIGCLFSMIQYLPFVMIGRFIGGILIGLNGVVISLYNVEMVPVHLKGIMSSISMTMQAVGILLSLAAGFLIPEHGVSSGLWRILLGLPLVFHGVRAVVFRYILSYETPLFLVMQDREQEAREILGQIYTDNIEKHYQKVLKDKNAVAAHGNPTMMDMFSPKYRKAFLVVLFVMSGIQFCGFSPIFMFFNVFIAESAGNDAGTISVFATMMGVISLIASILANVFVERFGRRPLLTYGMGLMCISQGLYALIGYVGGSGNPLLKYIITIWPLFYRVSVGTLAFIYAAEVIPSVGVSMIVCANWIFAFSTVQTFLPLVDMIGVDGVMLSYAIFGGISVKLYDMYLIESKGRTKAEMLKLYNEEELRRSTIDSYVEMQRVFICK